MKTRVKASAGLVNAQYVYSPQHVGNRITVNPITGVSMQYDAAGNLTNDGSQSYTYDATGQQTYASATALSQAYDGDRLRVKKTESGATTYYVRSSVLGGQVVAEVNGSGTWTRGYVYLGGQMVAMQGGAGGVVSWVHQDPVTKSQRITNSSGAVVSTIDLDPWGGETGRSSNQAFQPHRYTTYERDANGGDEAMHRRYQSSFTRFSQPDPYDGSYNLADPQSFNRYAYVQNDSVNYVDPTGTEPCIPGNTSAECGFSGFGGWGGGYSGGNGWGSDPRPGLIEIITNDYYLHPRQVLVDDRWQNYHFGSLLAGFSFWNGFFGGARGGGRTQTQQPAKPPCKHVGSGQGDINFGRTKAGIGPTGGVQLSANKVHLYGGLAVGVGLPPQGSASLMVRNGTDISPGVNYSFGAGSIVGISYSGRLNLTSLRAIGSSLRNGKFSFGGTTPGVGASVTYVTQGWQIPCL